MGLTLRGRQGLGEEPPSKGGKGKKKGRDFKSTIVRKRVRECVRERDKVTERRERRKRRREEVVRKGRESGDGVTSYHNNQSNNSRCFFFILFILFISVLYIEIV